MTDTGGVTRLRVKPAMALVGAGGGHAGDWILRLRAE